MSCLNYFEENGTAYLIMDYDDGLPLSELLCLREEAGQPFTEEDLLAVVEPLLEGLAVVHRAGVLHRDIKPGNIFVRRQDDITGHPAHPVLIDFGAAKQNYLTRHSRSRAPYTEGYAAYEQVSSMGEIGPWTDLYSVGALMWRMVAGGCPGDARLLAQDNLQDGTVWSPTPQSADQRVYALYSGRPDPVAPAKELGRGRFSPHLLAAIDACLVLNPNDRVLSSEQLKKLLERSEALDSEVGSDGSELESIGDCAGAHSRQPTEQHQVEKQRHPDEGTGVRKVPRNIWRAFTRHLNRHEQRRIMFPGRIESRKHSKALPPKRRQATLGRTPTFQAVGIAATILSAFSLGAAFFLRIPLSPEQVSPSHDNVLFSAMRNQNSLLNLAGFTYEYFAFNEDPQFNLGMALLDDNNLTEWGIDIFGQSRSRAEYEYLKRKVRLERQDDNAVYDAYLPGAYLLGILAAISAAISDPVVFFPVGILVVLALRRGLLTTRRAALWGIGIGAVLCGSSVAVQQLILHITQEIRTVDVSVGSVLLATFVGGLVFGSVGAFMSRRMHESVARMQDASIRIGAIFGLSAPIIYFVLERLELADDLTPMATFGLALFTFAIAGLFHLLLDNKIQFLAERKEWIVCMIALGALQGYSIANYYGDGLYLALVPLYWIPSSLSLIILFRLFDKQGYPLAPRMTLQVVLLFLVAYLTWIFIMGGFGIETWSRSSFGR